MKVFSLIYTLLMFATLFYLPFQYPVPKIGGQWDAGYHCIVQTDQETNSWYLGRPKMQPQDNRLIEGVLSATGFGSLSKAEIPLKYNINYLRLFAEWFFITFISLIWMLAFRFSRTH